MKIVFLYLNNYCIILFIIMCVNIYLYFFFIHDMYRVVSLNNKRRGKTSSLLKKYDFVFGLFI